LNYARSEETVAQDLGLGQWGEVEKEREMTSAEKTRKEKIQRRDAECAEVGQRMKEGLKERRKERMKETRRA